MFDARAKSFLRVALLLAPFSLGLAACETLDSLNFLDEQSKKTPLSGERRALFPDGVPGVQKSAPPTQPTNSNVQVMPQEMPQQNPDAAPEQPQQPPSKQARTKNKRGPAQNAEDDDPWAGQRR